MKFVKLPPFPFVGNKSNRRDLMLQALKFCSSCFGTTTMFEPFGGSFYCTHVSKFAGFENSFINDYDGYSTLFTTYFLEHAFYVKSVCDEYPELTRADVLPPIACQKIDNYIERNCPDLKNWFKRLLSIYGIDKNYRKRLTDHQRFWGGVKLSEYIGRASVVTGHVDYRDFISLMSRKPYCNPNENSFWLVDPPYSIDNNPIQYDESSPSNIELCGIVLDILRLFPKAHIMSFGHVRNPIKASSVDVPDWLHHEELNEFFPPIRFVTKVKRPEYMHLWYKSPSLRHLAKNSGIDRVVDCSHGKGELPSDYDIEIGTV